MNPRPILAPPFSIVKTGCNLFPRLEPPGLLDGGINAARRITQQDYDIEKKSMVVNDYDQICFFLESLKQAVRYQKKIETAQIPTGLKLKKSLLDNHQKAHMRHTKEKDKCIFSEYIAVQKNDCFEGFSYLPGKNCFSLC